jgi:hypothetical protein
LPFAGNGPAFAQRTRSVIPAVRATRIDPAVALRTE